MRKPKTAIIIGAGPAGLTAAYELLKNTDVRPIVLEASRDMGGISRTIKYKGNRMDIGGHRFFSKSDRIMKWWLDILPLQKTARSQSFSLRYQGKQRTLKSGTGADPRKTDNVMLVRSRLSRILYDGKFYSYPIKLETQTLINLGWRRLTKMGLSYSAVKLRPRQVNNLEDFYINRFGREMYQTFFRDYTAKVWGVPCSDIDASWGEQRVQGLSISRAITDALKKKWRSPTAVDISQSRTEKSLIEHFLYPKLGPGHMWETVAKIIRKDGGQILTNSLVTKLYARRNKIVAVQITDAKTGRKRRLSGDYFLSTMPVSELIAAFDGVPVPPKVQTIASALPYRDFITVGLLVKKLRLKNTTSQKTAGNIIPDNWIYIQEPNVLVGRLQIFNNWSPHLVKNGRNVWLGLEYFVSEGDKLWRKTDRSMTNFGIDELVTIGVIDKEQVLDSKVVRVKKTYPAYFGSYAQLDKVRRFTDSFDNLFLLGRNGQHRYNNQDHSMLTAMEAVDNIRTGRLDKDNVWNINVESDYHETLDD